MVPYAIAVVSSLNPDQIVAHRRREPAGLGVSENGTYCASDAQAIRPYTNKVIYMPKW